MGLTMVDLILEGVRGTEDQNAARAYRHFLPGFGIAADALSLLPDRKAAERRDLDHFSTLKRTGDLGDHRFDEFGRLVARQADLLIDRFAEPGASNGVSGHAVPPSLLWKVKPAQKSRQIPKC